MTGKYVAILTRENDNKEHFSVGLTDGEIGSSIIVNLLPHNLSRIEKPMINLGIYSVNPCNISQVLMQSENGTIAWRVWEDSRSLNDISSYFSKNYWGTAPTYWSVEGGEFSRVRFNESSLSKLLEDILFRNPKTQR